LNTPAHVKFTAISPAKPSVLKLASAQVNAVRLMHIPPVGAIRERQVLAVASVTSEKGEKNVLRTPRLVPEKDEVAVLASRPRVAIGNQLRRSSRIEFAVICSRYSKAVSNWSFVNFDGEETASTVRCASPSEVEIHVVRMGPGAECTLRPSDLQVHLRVCGW
jgi:hypothetical protein